MRILITGAASRLGRALAAELGTDHSLRLMDVGGVEPEGGEVFQGSLLDPADAWQAVRGMDAIIHTGEPPPGLPGDALERDQALLDLASRGTHVLFSAGVEAGVRRFLYAGTLEVFRAYPDDVYISEMWKPLPAPDMPQMSRYLGELACREFARDHLVTVTALRLGKLVLEEEVAGQPVDPMWVDYRDAARAFRCALKRESSLDPWWTRRWGLYHVCADFPNPKYLIDPILRLGYRPVHGFGTRE